VTTPREAFVATFKARHVFEECADAIPGFLGAELLETPDDPDVLYIVAHWRDRGAQYLKKGDGAFNRSSQHLG